MDLLDLRSHVHAVREEEVAELERETKRKEANFLGDFLEPDEGDDTKEIKRILLEGIKKVGKKKFLPLLLDMDVDRFCQSGARLGAATTPG